MAVLFLLWFYVMASSYGPEWLETGLRETLVTLIAFLLIVLPFVTLLGTAIFRVVVFLLYAFCDSEKLDRFFRREPTAAAASD